MPACTRPIALAPRLLALAATLALAHLPATAALDLWGAFASGSARDCPLGQCSGAQLETDVVGPGLMNTATASLSDAVKADHPDIDYRVVVSLTGSLDLPELRALARADTTHRYTISTTARAMQGYLYSGLAPASFTLDVALSAALGGNGGLSGFVNVYDAALYDPLLPNRSRLANSFFFWSASAQAQPPALSFTLDPGDSVYLEAVMFASADSRDSTPSFADAYNTLSLSFRAPPPNLTPATQLPVPEPASLLLMALGGGWLLWRRRSEANPSATVRPPARTA